MSVLSLRRGLSRDRGPWLAGLLAPLATILRSFGKARRASLDFERLNRLTDRQLADLGFERAGLSRALFERHFR